MLQKTRGIALRTIKYSDNSVVAKIYTEAFGLKAYLVNVGSGKRSRSKRSLLQPLSCLHLDVYEKDGKNLQRIKEMDTAVKFKSLPFNTVKSSLALFIAEVIYKSIKEEEGNPALFNFLWEMIRVLDEEQQSCANFHLWFLIQFSKHLGFYPQPVTGATPEFFDLMNGEFTNFKPDHPHVLLQPQTGHFSQLIELDYGNLEQLKINRVARKKLLNSMIEYYQLHLPGMGEVKSHEVLEAVLA